MALNNETNINNINSWITTLQNYNNTDGNINLWRINLTGSAANKILKVVNNILTWADDNTGVAASTVAFSNLTPEQKPTYKPDFKPLIFTLLIRPGIASILIPNVGNENEWITSNEEIIKCTLLFLEYIMVDLLI